MAKMTILAERMTLAQAKQRLIGKYVHFTTRGCGLEMEVLNIIPADQAATPETPGLLFAAESDRKQKIFIYPHTLITYWE